MKMIWTLQMQAYSEQVEDKPNMKQMCQQEESYNSQIVIQLLPLLLFCKPQ